jgi:hypothetical protein
LAPFCGAFHRRFTAQTISRLGEEVYNKEAEKQPKTKLFQRILTTLSAVSVKWR